MRLCFGDMVEFNIGHQVIIAYVIGDHMSSTEDMHMIVIANEKIVGIPLDASICKQISAGSHDGARRMQKRYLSMFPGTLQGLHELDRVEAVRRRLRERLAPQSPDAHNDFRKLAVELLELADGLDPIRATFL